MKLLSTTSQGKYRRRLLKLYLVTSPTLKRTSGALHMSPEPSATSASAYDESSYVHMLERSATSDRLRCNFNIHESFSDPCQRFFNAISSGTYIRPHRHLGSWADEIITCVYGSALLVVFDDFGCVTDAIRLSISDRFAPSSCDCCEKRPIGIQSYQLPRGRYF